MSVLPRSPRKWTLRSAAFGMHSASGFLPDVEEGSSQGSPSVSWACWVARLVPASPPAGQGAFVTSPACVSARA